MKPMGAIKVLLSVPLLCFLLIMAGCQSMSSGKTGQAGFSKEKLCSLLTKEEVEAILKKKMEEPKFFVSECSYKAIQPSRLISFSVHISTDDGTGFNYNKESGRKRGRRIRQVEGIGDGAYFDDRDLHVLKKNCWLTFSTGADFGHAPPEDAIKALAKIAVGRIP